MSENDIILQAREIMRMRFNVGVKIRLGRDAGEYFIHEIGTEEREVFGVLYLNQKNEILEYRTIFVGSLSECHVHPREIFRSAIELNSARIIVTHNHPSGTIDPSPDDVALTKRLVHAGEIIGIEVLDHVIVAGIKVYSFQEHGRL